MLSLGDGGSYAERVDWFAIKISIAVPQSQELTDAEAGVQH